MPKIDDDYKKININGLNYIVCKMEYNNKYVPVILDYNVFKIIKKFNKNWHVNENGVVVSTHKIIENNEEYKKDIYLHDLVMKINNNYEHIPILHINRIGVDNRSENLIYDTVDKNIKKNLKKKSRIINLPYESGIDPSELPSYVWYVKEDSTHGDRFVVNIGDINWKSTSSKKLSLRYKLEETKKYLRYLKNIRTDLFEDYSMNGDLNNEGQKLLKSYIEISKMAGYTNIKNFDQLDMINNTDYYLSENIDGLTNSEIDLL